MTAYDKYTTPHRAAPTQRATRAKVAKPTSAALQHSYLREKIEIPVLESMPSLIGRHTAL
eukprot:6178560-Pleurochrysis_carterae.AAC.2